MPTDPGLVIAKRYTGLVAPPGADRDITAAEIAVYKLPALMDWFDVDLAEVDANANVLGLYPKRNRPSGTVTFLAPPTAGDQPSLVTNNGRKGIARKAGATGSSGITLLGNVGLILPAPPWSVFMLAKEDLGGAGALWSTDNTDSNVVADVNTTNQFALYSNFNGGGGVRIRGATTGNDGNFKMIEWGHDGTNGYIILNGVLYVTGPLAPNIPGIIRIGTYRDASGNQANAFEGPWEGFWTFNVANNAGVQLAMRDLANERRPGLVA